MENLEENLPANLEKLQISPMSLQTRGVVTLNPFGRVSSRTPSSSLPESVFQSLSLNGEDCPSDSCLCNKKKQSLENRITRFQRPCTKQKVLLRKSRLSGSVIRKEFRLRAPVLRLRESITLTVLRPSLDLATHLTSLDLSTARGKVLGLDSSDLKLNANNDFKSLVKSVDFSKLNLKSLSQFDTVSFIELRNGSKKDLIVGVRSPRRRTYSDSTALVSSSLSENSADNRPQASCSLQARYPTPDDTNIDELASYFDLFVHIPKKMSHMAEMMYI